MQSKELFCITSKSYQDLITFSLRELYDTKKFSDVTLVTEDQKVIKAHKFILSANSDIFKTILENKEIDTASVFLRGVSSTTLLPIVEFCYTGRVDVDQDCVAEFIETAADLKISEFLKADQVQPGDPLEDVPPSVDNDGTSNNNDGKNEGKDVKPT